MSLQVLGVVRFPRDLRLISHQRELSLKRISVINQNTVTLSSYNRRGILVRVKTEYPVIYQHRNYTSELHELLLLSMILQIPGRQSFTQIV